MKFTLMKFPGADEDKEDDDDRVPAADGVPEVDQSDEDEIGVEHGPPEEEDDEDDIDVDDPDGGVRLSKRGTLKHEARTLEHLLTHRYKNPYCNSCVRAKMKHHKTYRGAFRRKLTKFGGLITFDFMVTRKTTKLGYDTVKEILVIRDRYTGIIQSYPSPTKNTEDVVRAVKYFMGKTNYQRSLLRQSQTVRQGHGGSQDSFWPCSAGKTFNEFSCRAQQPVRHCDYYHMLTRGWTTSMFLEVCHTMCMSSTQCGTWWRRCECLV